MPKLDTTLSAITVYPDRARVTRSGKIALQSGETQLELTDLPITMNPDSARVIARGTAPARLLGLQIQRAFYAEAPAEQVRALESQIETLQDEMSALDARALLVKQNWAKLDALGGHTQVYATALASGEMSVEAQLALLDGLRVRAGQLDAELQEILVLKRNLDRRLQQFKMQLEQLRNARPRERYTALVEVEAMNSGDLTVELTYLVANAGWKPLYDLRLLEENSKPSLEVGYLAQVTQQTGEDWDGVTLALSTARPALAATLPELNPWYISPLPTPHPAPAPSAPDAARRMAAPMAMKAALAPAESTQGATPEAVEAEVAMARVDTSGAAVTYHVTGTVAVPADGAPHKVSVTHYSLHPRLDYVAAPKLVEAAYRRAKVTNDSPYTLLPGTANLFAGEEFIGATQLELTAPQGEIELYLGADDRLKVERELKRREVGKQLIGGKRSLRYGYEIRLENLLPFEAKVTLHDQFPVSRHEDIKVRLESADPKPTQQTELNLLDWELNLAAKEKRTIRFDFAVEYPQGMNLIGLP
jgi:uncharacterized protein (TIGR02231 family)